MRRFAVLLNKEIAEQWRTGRLPVVAVIFLLFGLASPVLAKYTPDIVKLAASSIDIHVPTPTIKDAVAQLIATPPDTPRGRRDAAMIELAYASGLRVSELVNLAIADVNVNAGFVRVTG